MNLCFSFIEQKVEDEVHISSSCWFSYPLAKKEKQKTHKKRPFPLEAQRWSCCKRRKLDRPAAPGGAPGTHTAQTLTSRVGRVCTEEPQILEALLPKHKHFLFLFFFSQREIKTLITADALLPNCAKQNKY